MLDAVVHSVKINLFCVVGDVGCEEQRSEGLNRSFGGSAACRGKAARRSEKVILFQNIYMKGIRSSHTLTPFPVRLDVKELTSNVTLLIQS
jgi:hypothetical protein